MTSFERSNSGYYDDFHEPSFNAISYTWGRFALAHGQGLKINGISWQVPCIDPKHFSVKAFQTILQKVAGANGLVWVDIACIDQEDSKIKMDEIGKQAEIFYQASQVYVWLSTLRSVDISHCLQALQDFAEQIEEADILEHSDKISNMSFLHKILPNIRPLQKIVGTLFSDPWFSSLWTLQEACLCPQAIWLSKDAQPVIIERRHDRRKMPAVVDDPSGECAIIKLDRSGLGFFERGLNVSSHISSRVLYTEARYRNCSEPLDRIYGIMQIYDFKLGSSKDSSRTYTLEDLEIEFGAALNGMALMTAQVHIHTTPPAPGTAWRPSRSFMLPDVYYLTEFGETMCSIRYEKGTPLYNGKICGLLALRKFWSQSNAKHELVYPIDFWQHYFVSIHMDASGEDIQGLPATLPHVESAREPEKLCPCITCSKKSIEEKHGLNRFLNNLPRPIQDYSVLLLGSGVAMRLTRPVEQPSDIYTSTSYTIAIRIGLLVVKPLLLDGTWRRVGIVSWEAAIGDMKPVHESLWKDFNYVLG